MFPSADAPKGLRCAPEGLRSSRKTVCSRPFLPASSVVLLGSVRRPSSGCCRQQHCEKSRRALGRPLGDFGGRKLSKFSRLSFLEICRKFPNFPAGSSGCVLSRTGSRHHMYNSGNYSCVEPPIAPLFVSPLGFYSVGHHPLLGQREPFLPCESAFVTKGTNPSVQSHSRLTKRPAFLSHSLTHNT